MLTKHSRGVLFISGNAPPLELAKDYLPTDALVIAADGGLDSARTMNVTVQFVIGDMDSVSNTTLLEDFSAEQVLQYPRQKALTDTELALQFLRDKGIHDISMIGGGGGRLDHLFALRELFYDDYAPRCWISDCNISFLLDESRSDISVAGLCPADALSIFPLKYTAQSSIADSGLYWSVEDFFAKGGAYSLSNMVKQDRFSLHCRSAKCLLILPLKKGLEIDY